MRLETENLYEARKGPRIQSCGTHSDTSTDSCSAVERILNTEMSPNEIEAMWKQLKTAMHEAERKIELTNHRPKLWISDDTLNLIAERSRMRYAKRLKEARKRT